MKMESEKSGLWETSRVEELRDGDYVETPGGDISKQEMPPWYDAKKFRKAKEVYKEHFASVNFSHLCGLLLSFYFTKNIKTLLSTGESNTTNTLFHRYLATIRHVQKWYEGDVWDVNDPAHKSLSTVRAMHARAAKKMAAKKDGIVYVSQWDMAITQWAFIGPMVLFKSQIGLHGCSDEEFEPLIHFWRVIGYLLGIEDKYNLCHGDYPQVVAACQGLLKREYRERVAVADASSVSMGKNVMKAINMIDSMLTWESMVTYIHELVDVPCPVTMGIVDCVYHWLMRFVITWLIQFPKPRAMVNDLFRFRLHIADKNALRILKLTNNSSTPNVSAG